MRYPQNIIVISLSVYLYKKKSAVVFSLKNSLGTPRFKIIIVIKNITILVN